MGHGAFTLGGLFELAHLRAHNEVLRGKNFTHRFHQLRTNVTVFSRQAQEGNFYRRAVWGEHGRLWEPEGRMF